MDVPLGVYWSIEIDFQPIVDAAEVWPCSLGCDWIKWPINDWHDLGGCRTDASRSVEASLYLFAEHQPISSIEISISHIREDLFNMLFRAELDARDLDGNIHSQLQLEGGTLAQYQGIVLVPDGIDLKADTASAAQDLLSPYAKLSVYSKPNFDRFRWVFAPKLHPVNRSS